MKLLTLFLFLVVLILSLVASGVFYVSKLANEPYPYSHVTIIVGPVATSRTVPVEVSLTRTKLCPYEIERRVYDADRQKWDETRQFSAPSKIKETFKAPVMVDFNPVDGMGEYNVRIGAKCNWVQRLWPNYGPWYTNSFIFQIHEEE